MKQVVVLWRDGTVTCDDITEWEHEPLPAIGEPLPDDGATLLAVVDPVENKIDEYTIRLAHLIQEIDDGSDTWKAAFDRWLTIAAHAGAAHAKRKMIEAKGPTQDDPIAATSPGTATGDASFDGPFPPPES
jgi:hypothetical protein